jgi:hypothetical protein
MDAMTLYVDETDGEWRCGDCMQGRVIYEASAPLTRRHVDESIYMDEDIGMLDVRPTECVDCGHTVPYDDLPLNSLSLVRRDSHV